jgi:hypothetical protein
MGDLIIMNTVWFLESVFVVDVRVVELDPPESAVRIHVSCVTDPGRLCRILDPGSKFFHPGSRIKVKTIPDPERHQRIKVF